MEEEKYEEASGEAAKAMIHQLAKVGDITCDDALEFCKLIQDGPLMSAHKQEVMDCIQKKVDFTKDSSGNSQTDYTSNKQKQMFHHSENYFTHTEWNMISSNNAVSYTHLTLPTKRIV